MPIGPHQMSESEMAIIKPEAMRSYIWLQCADGSIQQVEEEVAMFCPMICREIVHKGTGSSKNYAITLPEKVNPAILSLILDYCRFHQIPGRSNKERKCFDEKFVKTDTNRLCELASAADSLQLKPLVDLTSRALARIIEGKTPEEIRETFHIIDDLTEDVEVKEEEVDERSLDDLLSFINGNGDSKAVRAAKSKKKNKRKKNQSKDPRRSEPDEASSKKEAAGLSTVYHEPGGNRAATTRSLVGRGSVGFDFVSKYEFDDADIEDELDPARKEEIDREVEDFARRLNSDWPERMQEILSLGQERKPLPNLLQGNGSFRRCTDAGIDRRRSSTCTRTNPG